MGTPTNFAVLVPNLPDHVGLTQEQVAQPLGVSLSTVNVLDSGKREPLPFPKHRLLEMPKEAGLSRDIHDHDRRKGEGSQSR